MRLAVSELCGIERRFQICVFQSVCFAVYLNLIFSISSLLSKTQRTLSQNSKFAKVDSEKCLDKQSSTWNEKQILLFII